MKKIILVFLIIGLSNIFGAVDIRLTQISNTGGTLIFDVEAMSNAGDVTINSFQDAIQLNAAFLAQNPVASFSNQLFPSPNYNTTQDLRLSDGRLRFVYTYDSGSKGQISGSSWTKVLRITITYTQSASSGSIGWYSGIPDYYVTNTSDQEITGSEGSTLSDVPLPVELSSFNVNAVEGTKAQLNWETATEVNNYGFEIERSVKTEIVKDKPETESKWEKVGFVKGNGNSNSTKVYSFTDKNLVGGSKFLYRLKQIDIDGNFEYSEEVEIEVLPTKYELLQNYPNPFNPNTNIKFSLPEDTKVSINVYNVLGEKVASVLNGELKAGFHQVDFSANSFGYQLASGVYLYTIESKNFTQVKKMILMK